MNIRTSIPLRLNIFIAASIAAISPLYAAITDFSGDFSGLAGSITLHDFHGNVETVNAQGTKEVTVRLDDDSSLQASFRQYDIHFDATTFHWSDDDFLSTVDVTINLNAFDLHLLSPTPYLALTSTPAGGSYLTSAPTYIVFANSSLKGNYTIAGPNHTVTGSLSIILNNEKLSPDPFSFQTTGDPNSLLVSNFGPSSYYFSGTQIIGLDVDGHLVAIMLEEVGLDLNSPVTVRSATITAVPEPASYSLVAGASILVAAVLFRNRRIG
jgi:hypothetical protein